MEKKYELSVRNDKPEKGSAFRLQQHSALSTTASKEHNALAAAATAAI
jgi:hypothetical protein